jgi:kynurenine formamidase
MRLIDLTRELYHQEPTNPGAIPPQVWVWQSHEQTRTRYSTGYSYTTRLLSFPDHTSTHVDAPRHFDARTDASDIATVPLDWFYGPALCLDVSNTRQPEWIDVADLADACVRHSLTIAPRDIVLLASGHHRRTYPRPEYFTDYPGLTPEGLRWLHERGVRNFGVEAPNPGHPDDHDFEVHRLCQVLGMIHMEGLANLEQVVGQRFTFSGFPLKIRDGSGSPIRAVALLDDGDESSPT